MAKNRSLQAQYEDKLTEQATLLKSVYGQSSPVKSVALSRTNSHLSWLYLSSKVETLFKSRKDLFYDFNSRTQKARSA